MEIFALVAYFFVGALAGTVGGLLGLSGGVVTVPSLILIFNLLNVPQSDLVHTAIGTSLAAMVLNGIASSWAHKRRAGVMWDIVFSMIPGVILGCLLGATLAHFASGILLQILFGLFVCFLGAYVLLQKKTIRKKGAKYDRSMYTWLGLGIGAFSSLLGIGGGVFTVPLMLSHGHPEKKAVGTSAVVSLMITTLAAIGYLYFGLKVEALEGSIGYIYLPAFVLVGLGAIIFAPLGARWAHQIDGTKLRKVFAGTLILVGILMIFN